MKIGKFQPSVAYKSVAYKKFVTHFRIGFVVVVLIANRFSSGHSTVATVVITAPATVAAGTVIICSNTTTYGKKLSVTYIDLLTNKPLRRRPCRITDKLI